MTTKRNGEIDLLRFLFSIIIVIYHFNTNFNLGFFTNGYIGVEYFFVVSGYLMAGHVVKGNYQSQDLSYISDETWHYILKKVKSFYAYYISVILFQILVRFILVNHMDIAAVGYRILRSIPTFTLTFMGLDGAVGSLYVGNTWYLSAMLLAIFMLYPMLLKHYKFSVQILFPLISIFILGYFFATNKSISYWDDWSGIAYFGTIRALAEISLGSCLYQLSVVWTTKSRLFSSDKPAAKVLATIIKVFCYFVVMVFAYGTFFGRPLERAFDLHALLFCSLGILLSFSNSGYNIPDCRITRYLGKVSLPIFIYHGFIRWTIWEFIGHGISTELFAFLIAASIIASVLLMYVTDYISVWLKKLSLKLL